MLREHNMPMDAMITTDDVQNRTFSIIHSFLPHDATLAR